MVWTVNEVAHMMEVAQFFPLDVMISLTPFRRPAHSGGTMGG